MSKRLLITGSRAWDDAELIRQALVDHGQAGDTLVTGGARGADAIAEHIWCRLDDHRPAETWPADWVTWGRSAGPRRNQAMVDSLTAERDLVLAFIRDSSRGASQCARAAEQAGLSVYRYDR
jgi:hypothetical protein